MNYLYKFVRLNSCYVSDFRCSRAIYVFNIIRTMQLAALVGYCGQYSIYGTQKLFQGFLTLLTFTNPASWTSLVTGEGILIAISVFLLCNLALQFNIVYLVFSSAKLESERLTVLGYKFIGVIFEELLLIPISCWLFFDYTPNVSLAGTNFEKPVWKSPTWLYILIIVAFSLNLVLYLIGKVADLPFRKLTQDRIKTMSLLFELLHLGFPIAVVALTASAQNLKIDMVWPCVLSILYAVIDIALSYFDFGYKHPASRKLHCILMGCYFTHSIYFLVLGKLHPDDINAAMSYLDIIYFFCISFVVKFVVAAYKYLKEVRRSFVISKHGGYVKRRLFEEMLALLAKKDASGSLDTYLEHQSIVSYHVSNCKEKSCYCSSWKEISKEDPSLFLPKSKEFMETYYEELMRRMLKLKNLDMWIFIDFVLLQALTLEKTVKACFVLQRFRSTFTTRYQRFVIECLSLFLEEHFLKNLSWTNRDHFDVSFLNGITFDAKYKKMLEQYDQIHKEKSNFFQYLIESIPVDLNKLDEKGKRFMKLALEFEKDLEESLEAHETVETMALLIKFKQEMMDQSLRATRNLQRRLDILYLKKTSKHAPGHVLGHTTEDRFDYLDSNNIFLAIDLVQNIGEIIDYNSRIFSDLGYRSDKVKINAKMLVPRYVYDCLLSSLLKILTQSRYLESISKYVELAFLSDISGHIIAYEGCLKVEFMKQRGLCGAVALKRLHTQSQYILTKPSGEIISLSKELLKMFGIDSIANIIGKNVCFLMPELLKFFLETASNTEELYPNQNIYSLKFDTTAILEKHFFDRSSTTLYSTAEADDINNALSAINNQGTIDPEQAAVITEKFKGFARKLLAQNYSKFGVSLKIQKYNIDNKVLKVLEVFSCAPRTGESLRTSTNRFMDKDVLTMLEKSPTIVAKQETQNRSFEKFERELQEIAADEGQTAIQNFQMSRQDDFKYTMQTGLRPSRDTIALALRFDMTEQEKEPSNRSFMLTGEEEKDNPLRDTKNSVWKNISTVRSSKSIKETDMNQKTEEHETYHEQEEEYENQEQADEPQELISAQKAGSGGSARPGKSSTASKKVQAINIMDAINNAYINPYLPPGYAGSKASSSMTTTTKSDRIKYIIQHNFSYKILQVNFAIGIFGVLLIVALFTTQFVGYTTKLDGLTMLCTSMGYPAQLAAHLELLTQLTYRYRLYLYDWVLPTEWFLTMLKTVNFNSFLTVTKSFSTLILNAQNVSSAVNEYLAAPENMVTLNYIDGANETMAISMSLLIHNQAGRTFFNDAVMKDTETFTPVVTRKTHILDANTVMLFDKMLNMTEFLYDHVSNSVDSILEFNVILLIVVSITIALLAFCCVLMYLRINGKRVRMLSLFCTLSKSDLEKEYMRFNDKIDRTRKDSTKMKSGLIAKQQKMGTRRSFHEYSYHNKNKWPAMISFFFIFGLFLTPFIYIFTQTRDQIVISYNGVSDIRSLAIFGAHYASLFTNQVRYYTFSNESESKLAEIDQRHTEEYNACRAQWPTVQAFLLNYGNLTNQVIYGASVDDYVIGGLYDLCTSIVQSEYYTSVCRIVSEGIANQGIIEVVNYYLTHSVRIYNQIVNSSNATQALYDIGREPDIMELSMIITASNRLFRIAIDAMTYDVVQYMNAINRQALGNYLGITLAIIFVLGTGWVIWIKRLEIWLNKTKEIYNIIPIGLLEASPAIKGYFKQEIRNVGDI